MIYLHQPFLIRRLVVAAGGDSWGTETDVWQSGLAVVFDPIYWTVNFDDKNGVFAGVNALNQQAVRLMVIAERIKRIVTRIPKAMIEEQITKWGIKDNVVEALVKAVVDTDPARLGLRKLALQSQITSARVALMQGMVYGLPSESLFLIAFCTQRWTTGGLGGLVDPKTMKEIINDESWKRPASSLVAQMRRIEGLLGGQGRSGMKNTLASYVLNQC